MGQFEDMKIRLSGLESGVYEYRMQLDDTFFEAFKNEEIKGGKVDFDVRMERNERVTMFTFSFQGEVKTECDRCLGPMTVEVKGDEKLYVRFSDTETSEEEDVTVLPKGAAEIDLTPWLYEYVAVRVPMQHSHPEGECDPEMTKYIMEEDEPQEGECVDPRWEALKELK